MKKQAFLPLVTYPDANADAVAGNAVAVAAHLKADLHVVALSAQIREVSSVLSRRLLKVPHLVTEAEALSRSRGEHLLAKVQEAAARKKVKLTTGELSASVPCSVNRQRPRRVTSTLPSLVGSREIQPPRL